MPRPNQSAITISRATVARLDRAAESLRLLSGVVRPPGRTDTVSRALDSLERELAERGQLAPLKV